MKELIICLDDEIKLIDLRQLERDGYDSILKNGIFMAWKEVRET